MFHVLDGSQTLQTCSLTAGALNRPDTRADCVRVSVVEVFRVYIAGMGQDFGMKT